MKRSAQQRRRRGHLHHLPRIHDGETVGDVAHDAQIVRDEQHGHAEAFLEIDEQFENLRLNGHVQRGRRLVGDEQLGFGGQRHRDHHALLHPAGKLVRIIFEPRFRRGDVDELQQADHFLVRGPLRAVQLERLLDLAADAEDGIERGAGVLKNVTDHAAANLPQLTLAHPQHVATIQQNLSAHVPGRRRGHQPRDGKRGHALATAAFAHETDRLARVDGERHTVHGPHGFFARAEFQREVFYFEQGHSGGAMMNDE